MAKAPKVLTEEEKQNIDELFVRARAAQAQIENVDQETIDRAVQAVAWAAANEKDLHPPGSDGR